MVRAPVKRNEIASAQRQSPRCRQHNTSAATRCEHRSEALRDSMEPALCHQDRESQGQHAEEALNEIAP